jgi:addiction module HigA family antidote
MSNRDINEGGINGSGKGVVNTNSTSFKALKEAILDQHKHQSKDEKIDNKLLSLQLQMNAYLADTTRTEIRLAGSFLKEFVEALGIKNKDFANYIDCEAANLSALYRGNRKINYDLAIKFGKIFGMKPTVWINIQSKNALLKIKQKDVKKYSKYNLKDLLGKVG